MTPVSIRVPHARKSLASLGCLGIVVGSMFLFGSELHAQQCIPTCPPIVVVASAPTTDGGTVVCYGDACAFYISNMQSAMYSETHDFLDLNAIDEEPIEYGQFCAYLWGARPSECNNPNTAQAAYTCSVWNSELSENNCDPE